MYREKSIAVVVPAYNEEKLIQATLSSIPSYVDRIYAVDDASTDNTTNLMLDSSYKDQRIKVIRHDKNGGVGASIVSGYKGSISDGIDLTAVMAGDNQMDPEYLPTLLDPVVEGRADYSKGNRLFGASLRGNMSSWRYFGNVVLTHMNKLVSGYWGVVDPQNGYTVISRDSLLTLNLDGMYKRFAFENDMLVNLNVSNAKVVNVPIPARYGDEDSKIRYGSFILRTSAYFIKAFFSRIWRKYIARNSSRVSCEIHNAVDFRRT